MKPFGFFVLLFLFGIFSTDGSTYSVPDMALTQHGISIAMASTSRKLKEDGYTSSIETSGVGNINLEDYHPINPIPSSKASIRPGPIQYGTPLIPHVPKPFPPGHPKHGEFP